RPGQNFSVTSFGTDAFLPAIAANPLGRFVVVRLELQETSAALFGRIGAAPDALNPYVDPQPSAIPFNGILESGEEAVFAPAYLETQGTGLPLTGTLVAVQPSPPGSSVEVVDGTADFGVLPPGNAVDCLAMTGDCYAVEVNRGPNVIGHWDP